MEKLKFLAIAVLTFGLCIADFLSVIRADEISVKVPVEQTGKAVAHSSLSGCINILNTSSATIATTPSLLYSMFIEEGAATQDYVVFDATYIINAVSCTDTTNCRKMLPPLNPTSTTLQTEIEFDPPLRSTRGISVDATSDVADDYTVCYAPLKQ